MRLLPTEYQLGMQGEEQGKLLYRGQRMTFVLSRRAGPGR